MTETKKKTLVYLLYTCALLLSLFLILYVSFGEGLKPKESALKIDSQDAFLSSESKPQNDTSIEVPFSELITTAPVNDIFVDKTGDAWIATEEGLTRVSADKNTIIDYSHLQPHEAKNSRKTRYFPFPQATSVSFADSSIIVGSLFGICKRDSNGVFTVMPNSLMLPSQMVLSMHNNGKYLWMGTQKGAVCFKDKNQIEIINSSTTNGALSDNQCRRVFSAENIFIAIHDKGISFWDMHFYGANPTAWKSPGYDRLSMARPVNDVAYDGEHVWFAAGNGIFRLQSKFTELISVQSFKFFPIVKIPGKDRCNARSIVYCNGSVWAGTSDGLIRIKDDRVQMVYPSSGRCYTNIRSLHASDDLLWIGSDKGVQFINTAMVK